MRDERPVMSHSPAGQPQLRAGFLWRWRSQRSRSHFLPCDGATMRWIILLQLATEPPQPQYQSPRTPWWQLWSRIGAGCLSASEGPRFGESPAGGETTGCEAPTATPVRGYRPWAKVPQNNLFGFRGFRFQATKNLKWLGSILGCFCFARGRLTSPPLTLIVGVDHHPNSPIVPIVLPFPSPQQ
jgi:hypothetical protein